MLELDSSLRCLASAAEVIDFPLRARSFVAIPFLKLADQLIFLAGELIELVVGQLRPAHPVWPGSMRDALDFLEQPHGAPLPHA
jgi:hypothetical protein